jgi:two-component system response regulator
MQPIEILLVEDDLADIKLTQRALASGRIANNVHVVRDGIEAMQFLLREPPHSQAPRPDLVLLDLNMPRKDGREVLREVKAHPDLRMIPVVVLTTSAAETDILRSYDEYANSYMTKPVDIEQFRLAIIKATEYWFSVVRLPRI